MAGTEILRLEIYDSMKTRATAVASATSWQNRHRNDKKNGVAQTRNLAHHGNKSRIAPANATLPSQTATHARAAAKLGPRRTKGRYQSLTVRTKNRLGAKLLCPTTWLMSLNVVAASGCLSSLDPLDLSKPTKF